MPFWWSPAWKSTWGCRLTISLHISRNNLLAQSTNIHAFPVRTGLGKKEKVHVNIECTQFHLLLSWIATIWDDTLFLSYYWSRSSSSSSLNSQRRLISPASLRLKWITHHRQTGKKKKNFFMLQKSFFSKHKQPLVKVWSHRFGEGLVLSVLLRGRVRFVPLSASSHTPRQINIPYA